MAAAQTATSGKPGSVERALRLRDSLPEKGLFAEKEWRVSPDPFPIDRKTVRTLERLGPLLGKFQQACDVIYRRSRKGTLPGWIAGYLDRGKPDWLLEAGLQGGKTEDLPAVIRPDLILTEEGLAITELDSVPGGIGLTAWLNQAYAAADPGSEIVGGPEGMIRGFESIFSSGAADIAVSEESADYRPEMEWLARRLESDFEVVPAESFTPGKGREVYRFFELFDLPNLPGARALAESGTRVTPPFKPWLEEKMWAALLRMRPLRDVWSRELRDANFGRLLDLFPWSWIVDPSELPPNAVHPRLEIQDFGELKGMSQKERRLVLKVSGFSETAWGSRSVTIGHDASGEEWSAAVDRALASFENNPFVLQEFHRGRIVRHRWWNPESGEIETMEGRVRLCPYYFAEAGSRGKTVRLGGILATICPADKKILHGMSDAILAPCAVVD